MEKDPLKRAAGTAQDVLVRDRDLLLALSRATQAIQRARTAEDFYHAVGREIKSLGGNVTLLTINEDRRSLSIAYTSYASTLIRRAEKLSRLSAQDYPIPLRKDGYYGRTLNEGRAVFFDSTREIVAESLPRTIRPMAEPLTRLLKLHQGILAPLRLEDETLGLMTVSSIALTPEHLPAMESFAGQIAAGLSNVRLTQQLMEELAARRRAEESLQRNRDLLLALSRAAQDVQKMNDQEGIYRVVGEQIKALGFEATILMLDEEKKNLCLQYTTLARKVTRAAEKITGLTAQGYHWPIPSDNAYRRIIDLGQAEYIPDASLLFAEALPPATRPMTRQLMRMLGAEQGIIAPLRVDEAAFGLLIVFGKRQFGVEDLPAMDSFAGQVAISLRNLRLSQQVTVELAERKQAEEAVRRAEVHFRSLIEKAPDGIVLVGLDGRNKYASPAARSILGFDPEDDLQVNPLEYIHPDDMPAVLQAMSDLIQDPHRVPTLNYRYKHKNGSWRWLESTFSNLLMEPSVEAVVINFHDITARREAEDALKLSEARYRLLAENMTDTVWMLDMNLKTIYISPSTERVRGYTFEQFQDLPLDKNLTPESYQLTMETLGAELPRVLADPTYSPVHTVDLDFINRDGSIYSAESKITVVRNEAGVPVSILGTSRDITERRHMEKLLNESERQHRALIENSTDGILIVNTEGRVRYESPSVVHLLGYGPAALIGVSAFDLIHPDDLASVAAAFMQGLETPGYVHRGEYRLRHASGEWRYFEIISHYRMDDPAIAGIIINGRDITERRQAEDALRESERKFHNVISESTDGIILLDESGRVIEFNRALEEITGLRREDALQRYLWDLLTQMTPRSSQLEEGRARVREGIQLALQTGDAPFLHQIVEDVIERADGSIRHVQHRLFSMATDKGWRLGGVSRDITERKRTEDALRESETRWQFALEGPGDGIWDWDIPSGRVYLSRQWKIMLGYAEDEIGNTLDEWDKRIHPLDRDATYEKLNSHFAGSTPFYQTEHRLLCKDGTYKWILDRGKIITWQEDGQPQRMIGTHTDVTERKQAEEALRESKDRYRVLYEDNPSMYFTANPLGVILSANRFCVEQLGYSEAELVGRPIFDIFLPEDRDMAHHQFTACLQNPRQTVQIEARKVRKNGELLWVRETASAVLDGRDEMVVLINCIDITKRKHAEQALADSESEWRALFASMRDTVLVIDQDGYYRRIAPTHPGQFYILPENVIGKHLRDLFPADQVERFMALIQQVMETGQTRQIEYEIETGNNQRPWFEASVSPMGTDCTLWVARDITDRKQAQAALTRSEQAYRSLFENMPIGLYRTSLDGRILDANPALVRMFGYPDRDSLLAIKAVDLYMDPTYEERFQHEIQKQRVLSGFEAEFRRYGRSSFWAEDYVRLVYDEAGNPLYYEGSLVDVTERKQAEDKLRRANAALETAHAELQEMFAHEQILARTDGMTGLINRRHFFELATREFNASLRYQRPLTIILFDVDGFKQVNDTFGHSMGDAILVQIAQVALQQIRNVDILARYGGDEFIILLPETNAQQAFQIAERTRECVASTGAGMKNSPFSVTLSLGVAEVSLSPQDASVEDAIRRADQALYAAKAKGNNCTVIHDRHK